MKQFLRRCSLLSRPILLLSLVALLIGPAFALSDPGAISKPAYAVGLPPLPNQWPATLQLGMSSSPGDAAKMKSTAPFGFRYQYLAGGVNTGSGWATWNPSG